MNQFETISQLLRGIWHIEPGFGQSQIPLITSMLKGGEIKSEDYTDNFRKGEEKYYFRKEHKVLIADTTAAHGYNVRYYDGFRDAPKGSIGIIPVNGAIMKQDNCGAAGTATNTMRVLEANQNPNIAGILLKIDSPGGSVNGLATLYDAIKNTSKPTIAFIDDGGAYSAAYYIASACDKIIASHDTCGVGSIGTMMRTLDFSKHLEKEGILEIEVYAPQSKLKNEAFKQLKKGNDSLIKNQLEVYAQDFIDRVIEGRGDALKIGSNHDAFAGQIYFASEALELGLIDEISDLQTALESISMSKGGLYV